MKITRIFSGSMTGRILRAIIVFGILPFVLVSAWVVYQQSQNLQREARVQLQERAFDYAQNLNVFIDELQRDAAAIAGLIPLSSKSAEDQTQYLIDISAQYPEYGQVAYVGLDSYIQAASKPIELVSIAKIPSFQTAANEGRQDWVIAPALFNPTLVMHMHTPIFEAGELVGVFGSPVPLPRLVEIVTSGAIDDDLHSQTAYVVDDLGRILLHPDPDYVAGSETASWYTQMPTVPQTLSYEVDGVSYLAAAAPIPDLGWTMVVEWPYAEVVAPATRASQVSLVTLGLTIFLGLAGAVFTSGTLTKPLRNLVQAANAFGAGEADVPLPDPEKSGEEIGVLIDTFEEMRQSVTDREHKLHESEQRTTALLNALPDVLLRIDHTGSIVDCQYPNPTADGRCERSKGRQFFSFLDEFTNPESQTKALRALQATRDTGTVQVAEIEFGSDRAATEIRFSPGGNDAVLAIMRDVDAQRAAQRMVRKQGLAMQSASDGMAILNEDNQFTYVNAAYARIHGYETYSDLIGRPLSAMFPTQTFKAIEREILTLAVNSGDWREELVGLRRDNTTFHCEASFARIETGELICVVRDISERKAVEQLLSKERESLALRTAELQSANEDLAQTLESRDNFLAVVSHELRTPLNSILGMTETMGSGMYGDLTERQQRAVGRAHTSATHLLGLINDILSFAKSEAGQLTVNKDAVDLNALCLSSLDMIRDAADKKSLGVYYEFPDHIHTVQGDAQRLRQIIVNLLSNAVKFTPEKGRIGLQVRGSVPNEQLIISVWDTGIGIAPDDMGGLFQPFVQVDSKLSRKYDGTGLGLSLSKRLANLHDGDIVVESEVGKGSRFTLVLPWEVDKTNALGAPVNESSIVARGTGRLIAELPDVDHAHHGTEELSQVTPATEIEPIGVNVPQKEMQILLAEDNDLNVETISEFLEMGGYQVLVAGNGQDVLDLLETHQPDIILMDVQMPVMDGLQATRAIRKQEHLSELPIIAITGMAMEGDAKRCLDAGATDYLSKPLSMQTMLDVIAKYTA